MKTEILRQLAELKELTTYHYKVILFLLASKEATQTQIANVLDVRKQNINRVFRDLIYMNIVVEARKEGTSIYWKLNPKPSLQVNGQLKLKV